MEKTTLPTTAINLLQWLLLPLITSLSPTYTNVIHLGCSNRCGGVAVPYPFAIGDPKCAFSDAFFLNCSSSTTRSSAAAPPQLLLGNIPVTNISVEEGTFSVVLPAAYSCYGRTGSPMKDSRVIRHVNLGGRRPFRFSDVHNKLTAFGCGAQALITNEDGASGCVSVCGTASSLPVVCPGIGCCQSPIPQGLKTIEFATSSTSNHSGRVSGSSNPCSYAYLADDRFSDFGGVNLAEFPERNPGNSIAAIEWVVEEKTCEAAMWNSSTFPCRKDSDCVYSKNGNGYRCSCKPGFRGNPYFGCQDINECAEPEKYPCRGRCKNTQGSYACSCPFWMRGDGKDSCQSLLSVKDTIAVCGGIISFFTIVLLAFILYRRREREKNFLLNGGMLLEHQRVRIFKESELSKATKNYDASHFLGKGGFGHVYKGILPDNTLVAIKKPNGSLDQAQTINQEFQHEIAIVSQVNHINVVKVLGLCLETKLPLLVYEFIPNGTLFDHIHRQRSSIMSTWKNRLRIAAEIAQALDYLHSLANPPIIHGDIKSTNILLDEGFRAKVADFGASVLIYPDQATAMVNKIQGTLGYLDPEYLVTGNLTPMSDVYSFGVVMVELLTGEKPYAGNLARTGETVNLIQYFLTSTENMNLGRIINFAVVREAEMDEIEAFAEVARRCLSFSGTKRPTMNEVAEELGRLRKLNECSCGGESCMSPLTGISEGRVGTTEEQPPASIGTLDMESYEIGR